MLSREEQVLVLIETLEKVEKPTKWKELVELEPLKNKVGQPKDTKLPSANSYRSVMSSKTYENIFLRDKQEVVFYGLKDNYKQEFEKIFKKESN
jgi:hypothetical protein